MAIQFAPSGARAFGANTTSKHFEVCNIRFTPAQALVWGLVGGGVDELIVEIHGVQKGSQPELSREAEAINKKCP